MRADQEIGKIHQLSSLFPGFLRDLTLLERVLVQVGPPTSYSFTREFTPEIHPDGLLLFAARHLRAIQTDRMKRKKKRR